MMNRPYDDECDVAIIGAGIGGLSCAAFLAQNGLTARVFERHSAPGGYCTSFTRNGFLFNAAVVFITALGPEGSATQVLSDLGLKDRLEFRKIEPFCRVVFPGKSYTIPASIKGWADVLSKDFPAESETLVRLLSDLQAIARDMKEPSSASPLMLKYRDKTTSEMLDEYELSARLKAVLSSVAYNMPPSRFLAPFWCTAMNNRVDGGTWWPMGGAQTIADALVSRLSQSGGQIELNTGVRRILVQDGRAVGIETNNGRRVKARFVVSNAAARQTFGGLISQRELAAVDAGFIQKLRCLEVDSSSMDVHLGVDMDVRSVGATDYMTFVHESFDVQNEWEAGERGDLAASFCAVTIPTLLDPSLAPPNQHIVHISTYAPYYLPGGTWSEEDKRRLADALIRKAERVVPGVSEHILFKEVVTPRTFEKYTSNTEGATAGWAYTPANLSNRPGPKTPIGNLYLAGHWTSPGGSVRNTMTSGRATAQMIMSQL